MNYVDDGYVVDDLLVIVRELGCERRLSIYWLPEVKQNDLLNERVLKSIANFKADLPRLIKASGAEIEMISQFRTDIFLQRNFQIAVEGILTDDRGSTNIAPVFDF